MPHGNYDNPKVKVSKSTPKNVQGNQGKSVKSTVTQDAWHYQSRPTGNTPFPGKVKTDKAPATRAKDSKLNIRKS